MKPKCFVRLNVSALGTALALCVVSARLFSAESGSEGSAPEAFKASYAAERLADYEEAIKSILPFKDLPNTRYIVNYRMGYLYYLAGNYANSRNAYQTALKVNPSSIEAKIGYLLPVLAQGNYDEAEMVCKQVTDVDRYNYYANLRLAFSLRMQRKFLLAEKVNQQMMLLFPGDITLMTEQGLTKVGLAQKDQAKKIFTDILILDSENATAKYWLSK